MKMRKAPAGSGGPGKTKSNRQAARNVESGVSNSLAADRAQVTERAQEGVAGGGRAYPFLEQIGPLFGDHDVAGLSAHIGGQAGEVCQDLEARAFAHGDSVAFKGTPDLWTAAHEAAHCIAQSAGESVAGGVGNVGDAGEQMANAVADRVARGESAAELLPSLQAAQSGTSAPAVQFYKEVTGKDGETHRVSDDGDMIVQQWVNNFKDGSQNQYGTHEFWTRDNPEEWSESLEDVGSVIELENDPDQANTAPWGTPSEYNKVWQTNTETGTDGDDLELWADCGRSARDVTGVGDGTGWNTDGQMTAVYNKERDATFWEKVGRFTDTWDWDSDMKVMAEMETKASSPKAMKLEILSSLLGGTGEEAVAKYEAMSDEERLAFDAKAGINRAAAPEVGEGYTMASHGNSYPVANERDRYYDKNKDGYVDQWNFHWAGVVGRSGGDTVSLENYATGDVDEQNTDWEHQMYGSKDGQTFWDNHKETKQHGDMPFAFRVRKND